MLRNASGEPLCRSRECVALESLSPRVSAACSGTQTRGPGPCSDPKGTVIVESCKYMNRGVDLQI